MRDWIRSPPTISSPSTISGRGPTRSVNRPDSGAMKMITPSGRNGPGLKRRVVQDVLHVERQEEELGEHREVIMNATMFTPPRSANEKSEVEHRRADTELDHDEADQRDDRDDEQAQDPRRAPMPAVALHEREHKRRQPNGQRHDAGDVDATARRLVARLARGEQGHRRRPGRDRRVDEEDRAPAHVLDQQPSRRADRERQRADSGPCADGRAPLFGGERLGDDR